MIVAIIVGVALVPVLVVGEGYSVIHAIGVVRAAVGGEGVRHGLGTKAFRLCRKRNDAAKIS